MSNKRFPLSASRSKKCSHLKEEGAQVILLDARTERAYEGSDLQIRGAIRLVPNRVEIQARILGLPDDAWLIAYCA
jgi:rhodanese-related sulfurtransferase